MNFSEIRVTELFPTASEVAQHPLVGTASWQQRWTRSNSQPSRHGHRTQIKWGKKKLLAEPVNSRPVLKSNVYIGHVRFEYDSSLYAEVIALRKLSKLGRKKRQNNEEQPDLQSNQRTLRQQKYISELLI